MPVSPEVVSKCHAQKLAAHAKDPTSNFLSLPAVWGRKKKNNNNKTPQIPRNTGKIIRIIIIVTTHNEKSNKIKIRRDHTPYIKGGGGGERSLGGREIGEEEVN